MVVIGDALGPVRRTALIAQSTQKSLLNRVNWRAG